MQEATPEAVIQAIFVITGVFLLVAMFFLFYLLYFRQRKSKLIEEKLQLLQSQVEVQEFTYRTISKDIHDNVGQLLSTSKMLLGVTARKMTDVPDTLISAETTIGDAIKELRALSRSLDKDWLAQFSLVENLNTQINRINEAGEISAKFACDVEELTLSADEQIILFRIIQEGMQNAIRHAKANNLEVKISEHSHELKVTIADDGNGFDLEESEGMGTKNMKYRTSLLKGTFQRETSNGRGTIISISIPSSNKPV